VTRKAESFVPTVPQITEDKISENYTPASEKEMLRTAESFTPTAPQNNELVTTDENVEPKSTSVSTANTTNTTTTTDNSGSDADAGKESFWDKNKKWIKPVAIGVGGLTLIAIGFKLMNGNKHQNKSSPESQSLSGTPRKRKQKRGKNKPKHHHKKAVALL
jgi:hypothetical protein